jgi:Holliday junction resolvasome RuvABC endonuclease subunit|nr:MAG TPA_asm: RuvC [Caudoviricetes sp.]
MKIIGIDMSSQRTGIALFDDNQYVDHVLIDLHKIKDTDERIRKMMKNIKQQLNRYKPDVIVMEECLMTNNIKTVKVLSYIAGAIISWADENNTIFKFQLPTAWRKKVGIMQNQYIKREQLKQEAIEMVKEKFGLDVTDDEAESILLAYSLAYNEKSDDIDIEI